MIIYQDNYRDYYKSERSSAARVSTNRVSKGETSQRKVKKNMLNRENIKFIKDLGYKVKKV